MTVYVEVVFLQNALIDGLLATLALRTCKATVKKGRIVLTAALGGIFAVVYPLLGLPASAGTAVKAVGGIFLSQTALRRERIGKRIAVCAAFFLFSFAFGGMLLAANAFLGTETAAGEGFLVERAPVSLLLCGAVVFVWAVMRGVKKFYRLRQVESVKTEGVLSHGGREAQVSVLLDSGNLLTFRGAPVSVVSAKTLLKVFGAAYARAAVGAINVQTVNGERDMPVFVCDKLTIGTGKNITVCENAYLTLGDAQGVIVNPLLSEENHGIARHSQTFFKKNESKRKRRQLPVR